jgi:hypothetical protein
MNPRRIALILAAAVSAACGNPDQSAESASAIHTDSAGGLVIPSGEPYRETDGTASTALVVNLAGDSTAVPTPAGPCTAEPGAAETIFWVDGVRAGKPLPNERRYDLTSSNCGIAPRVQATVIGGAVNVFNETGEHRLVFLRAGTSDTLQTMPFSKDASIVATDRLTRTAGVVEVRCSRHANEKAYIAVFDQPYFGVGTSGDKVTLDALPPGDYRVMTWHEGLAAPIAVPTKVGTAGQTEIILR